jgi:cysteinyl-tRNA synthetase
VKYWLHGAHLLVEGKKMSKSLGNFFTLRDLLGKGYTGREVRSLLLSALYRETFNFTLEGLDAARQKLARIDECLGKLKELAAAATGTADPTFLSRFADALDDDLNVSAAWAVVFDWVRETNKELASGAMTSSAAATALASWQQVDRVFALGVPQEQGAPPELLQLLEDRQAARKAKDFKKSDAIRDELKARGWVIEDTPKGPRLKKL